MKQDAIWDYFQTESPEIFDESYARLEHLCHGLPKGCKVLNIGIGNAAFEKIAIAKGLEIYALDPSEQTIIKIRDELKLGDRAQKGSAENIPFPDASFEAVILSEVLEHTTAEQTAAILREIKRVLTPGGCLLGTVPADEILQRSLVVCPHCQKRFHRWGHVQSFGTEELESALTSAGFQAIRIIRKKFVPWRYRRGIHKLWGVIKVLSNRLGVRWPDSNFVFQGLNEPSQFPSDQKLSGAP